MNNLRYNTELEINLIASMLIEVKIIGEAIGLVKTEYFYDERNRIIFQCLKDMYIENIPVDAVTLINRLKLKQYAANTNHQSLVLHISEVIHKSVCAPSTYRYYCGEIEKLYNVRVLQKSLNKILTKAEDSGFTFEEILQTFNKTNAEIFETIENKRPQTIEEILPNRLKYYEEIGTDKTKIESIPTGYKEIDEIIIGLTKKHLTLIAARPGMGKTAFMLNLAYNISGKGKAVGIISLEQDENELADRLISLASGINSLKIRKGELSQGDWSKIIEGAETIAKLPIYIIHLPGARIMEILIKMKQMKENHNCEVLFIDHLDEIDKQDSINNENITNIIENYVKKIRDQGIYLNAAVCALHQINRNVESRTDKRPKMADLRNCGALEQKADEGILLYRDKKYNPDNYEDDDVEIAEIIIGKNRNGPIRNIKLSFDEETIKFETYYV